MVRIDMDAIRRLSVEERLALVEEIWASISDEPEAVPITEGQLLFLATAEKVILACITQRVDA